MHCPPYFSELGDVVVGEGTGAAFGEDVGVVETYHCDGEDARTWLGLVSVVKGEKGAGGNRSEEMGVGIVEMMRIRSVQERGPFSVPSFLSSPFPSTRVQR